MPGPGINNRAPVPQAPPTPPRAEIGGQTRTQLTGAGYIGGAELKEALNRFATRGRGMSDAPVPEAVSNSAFSFAKLGNDNGASNAGPSGTAEMPTPGVDLGDLQDRPVSDRASFSSTGAMIGEPEPNAWEKVGLHDIAYLPEPVDIARQPKAQSVFSRLAGKAMSALNIGARLREMRDSFNEKRLDKAANELTAALASEGQDVKASTLSKIAKYAERLGKDPVATASSIVADGMVAMKPPERGHARDKLSNMRGEIHSQIYQRNPDATTRSKADEAALSIASRLEVEAFAEASRPVAKAPALVRYDDSESETSSAVGSTT